LTWPLISPWRKDQTMTRDEIDRLAIIARGDDVDPLDAGRLDARPWGWTAPAEPEQPEPPPEEGSFMRGLVYAIPIAIVLWAVLIWGISIAAGYRPWRF
jgi:hypothetical protein